ncbi:hypothetical protein HK104_010232 [Borealophlyctis nickersoniae]|nr:hypothetical protein HK104_010232 [Borealophlyctis nickersoniae]
MGETILLPGLKWRKNQDGERAKRLSKALTALEGNDVAFEGYHLRRAAVAIELSLSVAEASWIEQSGQVGEILVECVWDHHKTTARQHLARNFPKAGPATYDRFSVDMLLSCNIPFKLGYQFAALWWLEILRWSRIAPGLLLTESSFSVNALAGLAQDAGIHFHKWAEMSIRNERGNLPFPIEPQGAIFISPCRPPNTSQPTITPTPTASVLPTSYTPYPKCWLVKKGSTLRIAKIGADCNIRDNCDTEVTFGDHIPISFQGKGIAPLLSAAACGASYRIPDHPGDASVLPPLEDAAQGAPIFVAVSHCWPAVPENSDASNVAKAASTGDSAGCGAFQGLTGTTDPGEGCGAVQRSTGTTVPAEGNWSEPDITLGLWSVPSPLKGNIEEAIDVATALGSHIWMDVLCINQESSVAKTKGVNKMHGIYGGKCVVLESGGALKPRDGGEDYEDVRRIVEGRWMERMWTLQEGILPEALFFHDPAARRLITYDDASTAAKAWFEFIHTPLQFAINNDIRQKLYRFIQLRDRKTIGTVLYEVHYRQCSVPHDKMYSLCGLLSKLLGCPIVSAGYEVSDVEGRKQIWEQLVEGFPDWLGFEEVGMDSIDRSWIPKDAMPRRIEPLASGVRGAIAEDGLLHLTGVVVLPLLGRFAPRLGVMSLMEGLGVDYGYLLDYMNVTSDLTRACSWRSAALERRGDLMEVVPEAWRISEMKTYEEGFAGRFSSWLVGGVEGFRVACLTHDWGHTTHLLLLPNPDLRDSDGWGGTIILGQMLSDDGGCRKFCRTGYTWGVRWTAGGIPVSGESLILM